GSDAEAANALAELGRLARLLDRLVSGARFEFHRPLPGSEVTVPDVTSHSYLTFLDRVSTVAEPCRAPAQRGGLVGRRANAQRLDWAAGSSLPGNRRGDDAQRQSSETPGWPQPGVSFWHGGNSRLPP